MAKKNHCTRYAQVKVDNKSVDSKLHKALLKIIPRPVANLVYAMYLQPNVATAMDSKYTRNTQGEHSMSAVLEYLGFQNIVNDIGDASIATIEKAKGVRDSDGKLRNFQDPMEAYKIAKEINDMTNAQGDSHHLAATVIRHGTEFQVLVSPVSSATHLRSRAVNNSIFLWEALERAMGNHGVNMEALRVSFSDILNMDSGMINYIESIAATENKYITPREIQFLLAANSNSSNVQSLLSAFGGGIIATAQAVYDNYHVRKNPAYAGLIDRTLTESKNLFSVLDANFNSQTIDKVSNELAASTETQIQATLKQLNHKYGIDFIEYNAKNKHAKTLSEATARAITILERRINQLETRKGTREEVKKLSKLHDTLIKELESKRYYMGILNYLNEAYDVVTSLEKDLSDASNNNGTSYENAIALARILNKQNTFVDGYENLFRDLLGDLADVRRLSIDETLSQNDIDNIQEAAKKAYDLLLNVKKRGEELNTQCMTDICTHFLGDKVGPEVIANIVEMCGANIGGVDMLYSFGKLSDPICAAIGDMVRTAQDSRNEELHKYTVQIREATAELYKSGSNSEFIYEDDGHIISDYDWKAYQKAYGKARRTLYDQGLRGFELEEAMEQWEELNTEDLIVDHVNNRAERVPKLSLYAKKTSFKHNLTPAQLKYYETMMEIKGQIGTLLPEYAQRQFLPPQLRRDLITAITHAKEDGMVKFKAALKDKLEEMYAIKEDNTDWSIGGEKQASYQYARGTLAGKQMQQIPIFFVNKLSNQDELFKNFSAGIQALAATAENYHHMSEIVDIAEFMRTYIRNHSKTLGKEASGSKSTQITTKVTQVAQNPTLFILDHMYEKHFYGVNEKLLYHPMINNSLKGLIRYSSFKGLSTNFFGATANLLAGEKQLVQEAVSNTLYKVFTKSNTPFFGITDWALGFGKLFGAVGEAVISAATGKSTPSVILDLITNNKQSKDYLMAEYFDLFNENYDSMMHTNYHKGFRQLLHDISFMLYGAGEKAIRYNTLWAMENATKVKHNGKTITLRDAFEKVGPALSPHLELKANLYDINGEQITDSNGKLTEYGRNFLNTFKKRLRYSCQSMFGAMNDEDKGLIHMYVAGKAAMNFRQWMIEHFSKRLRGEHWDYDLKDFVKGYWTETGSYVKRSLTTEELQDLAESHQKIKFMGQLIKNLVTFRTAFRKEWTKSTETQKLQLLRLMSSVITYSLLFTSACWVGGGMIPKLGLGDKDEEKRRKKYMDPARKFAYYQLKRQIFESESSTPWGAFINFENLVKSPIPAVRTFDHVLYPITGLEDMNTTLQSGPDKGMNLYQRNILKYTFPFWRDYKRLVEFPESDALFGIYENQTLK